MTTKPLVVLIHGLHQRGFIMRSLAHRLRKKGYATYLPSYRSLAEPVASHSARINRWLETNHEPKIPIHLVGHSLGGLVMRDFIHRYPQWTIGNSVSLGTPHMGSVSADYIRQILPPMVGKSYEMGLDGSTALLPDTVCLGVIAGRKPSGLGQFFLNHHARKAKLSDNERIHDGTVFLDETHLPNAADHIVLDVTHTGMLFDKTVAKQTVFFLKNGRFNHDDTGV